MEVRHADEELEKIEADANYNGKLCAALARSFRKVMNLIRSVANETELRHFRSLRFEKLRGNRSHQYSLRIDRQWRLIIEFELRSGQNNNVCVVISIEDYH